jgi:hypothetical protein
MLRIATSDPNDSSLSPSNPKISGDGSKVVFASGAAHHDSGDTNGESDIFVYDVNTRETKLVSKTFDNLPANGSSSTPVISGNGKVVAFISTASNLVAGDDNGVADLFLVDLDAQTIELVSKSVDGTPGNQAMRSGKVGTISLNYEGTKVVFESSASNLVPNDNNGFSDIFLFDRSLRELKRVNLGAFAGEANGDSWLPSISPDGRYVGYISMSTNVVTSKHQQQNQYFIYDSLRQTTDLLASVSPQPLFGDYRYDSPIMVPQFTGADSLAMYVSRAITTVNMSSKSIVTFERKSIPEPNRINIHSSTFYSSNLPARSLGQELIDGTMTIRNSVISKPSTQSERSMNAARNESHPAYFNTSFVTPSEIEPLADNGGPTLTHRIPFESPAFQAIQSFQNQVYDQRGHRRNGFLDAGAFENVGSTLQGRVFIDANGNGVFDNDEVGVPDAVVYVDFNRNGQRDETESQSLTIPDNLTTLSTNESGLYTLENIASVYASIVVDRNGVISRPVRGRDNLPTTRPVQSMDVSRDGRFVVFSSNEPNLVPNDTNGVSDIFLWDRTEGALKRVSVSSIGAQANGVSEFASISSDGSTIVFQSRASNLVANDNNSRVDVFAYSVATGITRLVSVDINGIQGNQDTFNAIAVDAVGQQIAFASRASNLPNNSSGASSIFIKNLQTGVLTRISEIDSATRIDTMSNAEVLNASFSDDFRFVTFTSELSNLVPTDTNGNRDIFLLDRSTSVVSRINFGPNGEQANNNSDQPSISGDGRYVSFTSTANNLYPNDRGGEPDLFIYDRQLGNNRHVTTPKIQRAPSLSADGNVVGLRINTGSLQQFRLINLQTGQYTSVVSSIPTSATFSSVLADGSEHVLVNQGNSTYIWESFVSQGPVVRLADATSLVLDFPVDAPLGSISGGVFVDAIENGQIDVGENPLANAIVFIDSNNNGQRDNNEVTQQSDATGHFSFSNLQPERSYRLLVVPPAGFRQVAPQSPFAWQVYLPAGANITDRDFGFVPATTGGQFENASIAGRLFNDLNGDGLIQSGESGLVGITVYLDLNGNETRDFNEPRTVTDANGNYSFASLGNRAYTVRTILPTGTVQTSPLGSKFGSTALSLTTGSTQLANPQDVLAEDFNNDGWADIAVALFSGNSVSLRLNDGAGNFNAAPINVSTAPDGLGPIALAAGRLNAGTAIDLITANQLNGTATILRDFNGTGFASRQTLAVGQTPTDVILGRFDNDEDLDAVVANKSTDQLTLLINNGSGVFTKGASFSSGGKNPTALVTGLFNNDTIPDIAVANYGTHPTGGDFGNVAVLIGRGDGTFHPAVPYTVGFGPISIASGDFNGDGFIDLVTANFLANTASVLLGSSSGAFTVVSDALGVGQGPLQVSTGDIEGDGDLDVLVTNLLSQSISVIRNRRSQGGTGFEPAESFGWPSSKPRRVSPSQTLTSIATPPPISRW